MQNKKWFTISEAANYLGVSPDTLRRWEKTNKIRAPKRTAGGARRYSKELLDEILEGDKKEKKKEIKKSEKKTIQISTNKKSFLFGFIAFIITLAILLPLLIFLF